MTQYFQYTMCTDPPDPLFKANLNEIRDNVYKMQTNRLYKSRVNRFVIKRDYQLILDPDLTYV